jgi:hypothetical protein
MDFHIRDNEPLIDLEQGVPTLNFWFSDLSHDRVKLDTLMNFAKNVGVGDKEVTLDVGVPIANIVDYTIEGARLGFFNSWAEDDPVRVSDEDRPKLDAIKAALLEAVAKIDRIEYVPAEQVDAQAAEIYKLANEGKICDVP